jgi:hypothetical protein
MVAITTLTGIALHTGGSAAHPSPVPAPEKAATKTPATLVTLSDRAQQLLAEAKAAQMVGDIFALANGVAASGEGNTKTQALIAHDLQANAGLYILWSSTR